MYRLYSGGWWGFVVKAPGGSLGTAVTVVPIRMKAPGRLGSVDPHCAARWLCSLRCLRGPPSPRRPAPSSPARISNLAGHRVSPASLADRVGLKGPGRSLHPGRRKDRNEVRTAASVPRARRAGPPKTSEASLPVPGWVSDLGLSTILFPELLSFIKPEIEAGWWYDQRREQPGRRYSQEQERRVIGQPSESIR